MFDFNEDNVDKIEISNDGGDYVAEYISGTGWSLTNTDEFTLNDAVVASMATNMSSLKASKILEDEDPSKYGFDTPIKVSCYIGDEKHTILVGDATPTYENFYAMKENDDNIYLIGYSNGAVLSANKDELKQTYIFTYKSYNIDQFALWEGKESDENVLFSMSKDADDNWSMEKPYKDNSVYYTQVDEFLTDAAKDQISTFVQEGCTEAEYSKFGFDNPQYVFEVSAGEDSTKVIFGDMINDGEEMYGLFVESGQVVTFIPTEISLLNYSTLDMMNTSVFSTDISNVANVSVTINKNEVLLDMSGGEENYLVNKTNVSEISEDAKSAFVTFFNSFNNAYFEADERTAQPSGDPTITIQYTQTNNIVTVIEYIPVPDSDKYYSMKNGEYTGFVVDGEIIDAISSSYENLMNEIK
ncbi:MAG: DUF4340 domain-containing protein [Oscillospiraceae bacterium]|nr:DUF4340 domain-containing protein [Oscillospiraceae bacterium]